MPALPRPASQLRRQALLAFVVAVLAGLGLLAISEYANRRAVAEMAALSRYSQARLTVDRILKRVHEAEAGQRGYLLTGRPQYLEGVQGASREVEQWIGELEARYYGDNPALLALLRDLESGLRTRLSEIDTTLSLYDQGRHDSWRALLAADIGRERMNEVKRIADRLFELESTKIEASQHGMTEVLALSRIGVIALTLTSLLAFLLSLRRGRALAAERADAVRRQTHTEQDRAGTALAQRTQQMAALERLGLAPSLELLAREFSARTGVEAHCTAEPVRLRPADRLTAYRVAQEALSNVARHAQASQVDLILRQNADAVVLEVQDNGRGFIPEDLPAAAQGLAGLRQRLDTAGGRLEVVSVPGQGCLVRAWLPAEARASASG